ncbi:MAG: cytosine deaminase [Scytolyngbya sp. HA4215-MV1]|jgi:cytosine deaminase|nr:cytosine deaminase [Scytolyngbya sp. HA4215-MV1]
MRSIAGNGFIFHSEVLQSEHYWLKNAHVPSSLLDREETAIVLNQTREGLSLVDIEVRGGAIAQIVAANPAPSLSVSAIDLRQGMVLPCFIDIHTHLDKGQIWNRTPNLNGTFTNALEQVKKDCQNHWHAEDVYRRMEFGLKCSYVHGTQAIRTHIDALGKQAEISLGVLKRLQAEWAGRLSLQAASLVPLEIWLTPEGEILADQFAEVNGLLGGFALMRPDLDAALDRVFVLAKERDLDLDFHCDETNDPHSITLRHVAQAAIRHQYEGRVICGHCCSLAVQSAVEATKTLDWVQQAGIGIVSLPMCNLYLQDRQSGRTPRWRGVTLLHELKQRGVDVAISSDNCRDPFFGFGDHDALEVFNLSTRIAHLDAPYGDWINTITATPAKLMGLPALGRLARGLPANLVLFRGRSFSELLSRSQHDRVVLRRGKAIDTTLPDYAELDDLLTPSSVQAN